LSTTLKQIAAAARKARHWTEERDRLIVKARVEEQEPLRTVGEAAQLSHTAVGKIADRGASVESV